MALPRLSRLVRSALAPVLLAMLAATAVSAGAVVSTTGDEPMPASRLPVSRPAHGTAATQTTPTAPPKAPCPHPHKCTGTAGTVR